MKPLIAEIEKQLEEAMVERGESFRAFVDFIEGLDIVERLDVGSLEPFLEWDKCHAYQDPRPAERVWVAAGFAGPASVLVAPSSEIAWAPNPPFFQKGDFLAFSLASGSPQPMCRPPPR